ncbi:MAG: BrnT family toxin [Candidatus Hydrogenedentota bacterium]
MNIYPASRSVYHKIQSKHHIKWDEIKEVFKNQDEKIKIFRASSRNDYGQKRLKALGRTFAERYIMTVFIKEIAGLKIITARDMTVKEKKQYNQ